MENNELVKTITSLIDETLVELEDLKKSRYSAAEVDMGKMDGKMAGHPANGSMDKKDDEDEDKDKKDKEEEAKKAEGTNSEADPGTRGVTPPDESSVPGKSNLHQEAMKAEDDKKKDDEDKDDDKEMDKAEGKNSEADPGTRGVTKPDEASDPGKSNLMQEAKKSNEEDDSLKKSETLMKSYVDEKVGGLEAKLADIAGMVKELANAPVERKGVSATTVPLQKSAEDEGQPLQKSVVLNKLFEMKKSDPRSVDSNDICAVETGAGLQAIVDKYNLK